MNKYLTILLVVLTATGSEAQTLTSALSVPCSNMRFEQMLTPEQLRAMGTDIMSVLKVLKENAENDNTSKFLYNNSTLSARFLTLSEPTMASSVVSIDKPKGASLRFAGSSIIIRAPGR